MKTSDFYIPPVENMSSIIRNKLEKGVPVNEWLDWYELFAGANISSDVAVIRATIRQVLILNFPKLKFESRWTTWGKPRATLYVKFTPKV